MDVEEGETPSDAHGALSNCRVCGSETNFRPRKGEKNFLLQFYSVDLDKEVVSSSAKSICEECCTKLRLAQKEYDKKRRHTNQSDLLKQLKAEFDLPTEVPPLKDVNASIFKKKKQNACSACGALGHKKNSSTCPSSTPQLRSPVRPKSKNILPLHSVGQRQRHRRLKSTYQHLGEREKEGEIATDVLFGSLVSLLHIQKHGKLGRAVNDIWVGKTYTSKLTPEEFLAYAVHNRLSDNQILTHMSFNSQRGLDTLPTYKQYQRAKKIFHPTQNTHEILDMKGDVVYRWDKPDIDLPFEKLRPLLAPQYYSDILPMVEGIPKAEMEGAQYPINMIAAAMITEQKGPVKKALQQYNISENTFIPCKAVFKVGGDGHGGVQKTRSQSEVDAGDHGMGINLTLMKLDILPLGMENCQQSAYDGLVTEIHETQEAQIDFQQQMSEVDQQVDMVEESETITTYLSSLGEQGEGRSSITPATASSDITSEEGRQEFLEACQLHEVYAIDKANSERRCRPVSRGIVDENTPFDSNLIILPIQNSIKELQKHQFVVEMDIDGTDYRLHFGPGDLVFRDTMVDLKWNKDRGGISSGGSGSGSYVCNLCTMTQEEAEDVEKVKVAKIDRTFQNISISAEKYRTNPEDKSFAHLRVDCKGATKMPILQSEPITRGIESLHLKLSLVRGLLSLIVKLNANLTEKWDVSNTDKALEKHYYNKLLNDLKTSLRVKVDITGIEGNKCNVILDNVDKTVCLVEKEEHKPKVQKLVELTKDIVQQYSMSATSRKTDPAALDMDALEKLGHDYLEHVRDSFPFVRINHYQHLVMAHSREVFEYDQMFSPGDLSAQAQEKKNKLFHLFRAHYSSKITLKKNLEDAFLRDWLYSSPVLANIALSKKKRDSYSCSICNEIGHTKKKCKQQPADNAPAQQLDTIIEMDDI